MRIEILQTEQEALDRIHHLREQGMRENQLSVIHDSYKNIHTVEEQTDVETVEIHEDRNEESMFDRFVNWVSGRDTLDHLFDRFDVGEGDQNRYYEALQSGKILLAVEEDTEVADSHFRSAHISDQDPGGGPFVGTTEPLDPFIGGTHHPDGTPGTVAGDPHPGSAPEYSTEGVDFAEHTDEERLHEQRQDPEVYQNYRPRMHEDRGLRDPDEHIYSKDEREAYVTRGDGGTDDEHLRIDEPNYVTEEEHRDSHIQEPGTPGLDRISDDSLRDDYSEPQFDRDSEPEWDERREDPVRNEPPRRDEKQSEEARIREEARREELRDDERRRYSDGEIAEGDLNKPGEPIFGDGPKPEAEHRDEVYETDEERLRRRDEGLINPDGEARYNDGERR